MSRRAPDEAGRVRGSAPRKTFFGDGQLRDDDGSCAIAATPRSSASRGDRNATGSAVEQNAAAVRAQRARDDPPSVDLPAPFSPTSACIEPAANAERDGVERLDASELLGDVQELEVGSFRLAYAIEAGC